MTVYTPEEVAGMLKLPTATVMKHLREGRLKGSKVGRHWRVTDGQIGEYLAAAVPSAGEGARQKRAYTRRAPPGGGPRRLPDVL
jgi:excisionase family DNA binding protein